MDDYGLKEIAIEQACKDNGGQWKDGAWCKFDKTGGNEVEFEHQLEDRGLMYYYADKEYLGEEWDKYQEEKYERKDKKVCEDYNGEWKKSDTSEDRYCKIDNELDQQLYSIRPGYSRDGTSSDAKYGREGLGEEYTANIEDDICYNEDADSTNIKICMSDEREQQKEDQKIGKEECKDVNGDWKNNECTFYEDEQDHESPAVIED